MSTWWPMCHVILEVGGKGVQLFYPLALFLKDKLLCNIVYTAPRITSNCIPNDAGHSSGIVPYAMTFEYQIPCDRVGSVCGQLKYSVNFTILNWEHYHPQFPDSKLIKWNIGIAEKMAPLLDYKYVMTCSNDFYDCLEDVQTLHKMMLEKNCRFRVREAAFNKLLTLSTYWTVELIWFQYRW